jgi:RNA polymerase sigma-54 factor
MKLQQSSQQNLLITQSLQTSLEILSLPMDELVSFIDDEVSKNPLFRFRNSYEVPLGDHEIVAPFNLYEDLNNQIKEQFSFEEQKIALMALDHLDERGWLEGDFPEHIVKKLQQLSPSGIFGRNLKEVLLLQLNSAERAYELVLYSFDDLIKKRIKKLEKKFPDLLSILERLSTLTTRPGAQLEYFNAQTVVPDLLLDEVEGEWKIRLYKEPMTLLEIDYNRWEKTYPSKEENKTIESFKKGAYWLYEALKRRKSLLLKIGNWIIKNQKPFLDQKGPIRSIFLRELAQELGVHESTISRAISNKFILCPWGCNPLKNFISQPTSKQILKDLIEEETKSKTDAELCLELKKRGIDISRRTVAKYRNQLNLLTSKQRKSFK